MTLKTSTYLITTMILTIVYPIDGQWNQLNVTFCPDPDLPRGWEDANKKHCLNPSKILHCQTNHGENIIYSMCAEQQRCDKGTHAHLNFYKHAVECTVCSPAFFQPEAKESQKYTQPNCDRKKQACGDGKEVCEEATAFQDYKCRCIHEQGYFPEQNNCDCFTYDSTCTCGYCEEGKEVVNGTKCVTITNPSTTTTTAPTTTTTTATTTTTTTTTSGQALTVGISIGTVLSVIVIIIFILWCLQRKGIIKKKIFGGCKVCGDTEKAQHNDTTDSNTHASRPSQNGTADPSFSMNGLNEQRLEPTAPPGLAPSEPDNTENFGTNPEGQQPRATSDSSLQENQERARLLPSEPICSASKEMELVSFHIGKDWKKLGRKLGLSDGELETLKMDYVGEGQEEVVYQMLRKWNTGSYPGTLTMAQACVKIKRRDIAKRLESAKQQ